MSQACRSGQQELGEGRMAFDLLALTRGQWTRLVPDRGRYPGASEIVEQPGAAQSEGVVSRKSETLRRSRCQARDRRGMVHRVRRPHVDEVRDLARDDVKGSGVEHPWRMRLRGEHRLPRRDSLKLRQHLVSLLGETGSECWVVVGARTSLHDLNRGLRAAKAMEDVDVLGQEEQPGMNADVLPF